MIRFKICGITNYNDAMLAIQVGAYAIGFIFVKKSPRYIVPEKAKKIISLLPPFIQTVGVFVNEDIQKIKEIVEFCGLDLIQFHGDESPNICKKFMPKSVKAIRVKDESSLYKIERYKSCVRAILLDTYKKGYAGGTGEVFNWNLAIKAKDYGIPIILSGGIGPENIKEALVRIKPFAIDINSKIEIRPGQKSPILIHKFIKELNSVNQIF